MKLICPRITVTIQVEMAAEYNTRIAITAAFVAVGIEMFGNQEQQLSEKY
jgi:hypothetical protein